MHETAVEFAAGLGREDYPLLEASYAPNSRMPCTDFSPWIRDRLVLRDDEAIYSYILQIVAANPGVGAEISADALTRQVSSGMLSRSSSLWVRHWVAQVRQVLSLSFDDLEGLDVHSTLDLRTALVQRLPHGPFSLFASQSAGDENLAAVMAPYPIRFRDPAQVAVRLNAFIGHERAIDGLNMSEANDVAAADLVPTSDPGPVLEGLARLPLNSRDHLHTITHKALPKPRSTSTTDGPGFADAFGTWYATRQSGCDTERSLLELIAAGYLQVNTDPRARIDARLNGVSAAELHELLDGADVPHPKSATKARMIGLAQPFADCIPDPYGDLYELTPAGWDVARSLPARVADTARMWGAWGALHYDQGQD